MDAVSQKPTVYSETHNSPPRRLRILFIFIIFILLVSSLYYVYRNSSKTKSDRSTAQKREIPTPIREDTAVTRIGEENIYQSDLNYEYASLPDHMDNVNGIPLKDYVLEKITEDSIILQENKSQVSLTPDIYNAPQKNYMKRIQVVQKLKADLVRSFDNSSGGKSGILISIWPINMEPGKYVLSESKKIALGKITKLHASVVSGTISIEKAGEQIQSDTSLGDLDLNYKGNAVIPFKIKNENDAFIKNPELVKDLWSLPKNGISEIHDVLLSPTEEFYAFGQIKEIIPKKNQKTYHEWFLEVKNKYDTKVY